MIWSRSYGGHRHAATQPPCARRARGFRDDDAGGTGARVAQTGGLRGKVTDAVGEAGRRRNRTHRVKGRRAEAHGQDEQEGGVHSDWPLPGRGQGVGRERRQGRGRRQLPRRSRRSGSARPAAASAAAGGNTAQEQQKKLAELQTAFDAGVAASKAGNWDEAVAAFEKAAPICAELPRLLLQHRLRLVPEEGLREVGDRVQEGDRDQAGLRRSVECPRERVQHAEEARRGDRGQQQGGGAAQACRRRRRRSGRGRGGSAGALYNQGVILWNQQKYPEAKDKFEAATKADPKHGEAHYRLGMAYVNIGEMPKAVWPHSKATSPPTRAAHTRRK